MCPNGLARPCRRLGKIVEGTVFDAGARELPIDLIADGRRDVYRQDQGHHVDHNVWWHLLYTQGVAHQKQDNRDLQKRGCRHHGKGDKPEPQRDCQECDYAWRTIHGGLGSLAPVQSGCSHADGLSDLNDLALSDLSPIHDDVDGMRWVAPEWEQIARSDRLELAQFDIEPTELEAEGNLDLIKPVGQVGWHRIRVVFHLPPLQVRRPVRPERGF